MAGEPFGGDKKAPMRSPLASLEKRLITYYVPRMPAWVRGDHLTLCTIPWTAGMLLFGWLAAKNPHWLWASSFVLVLQWFTDSFDGALGRYREAGLIRWGYYMDHLLDYFFMGSVFVGYALLLDEPRDQMLMLLLMFVYGGMEANAWLAFAATNQFKITFLGIGPTEIRLLFIGVNTGIILFGTDWLVAVLPWALILVLAMLVFIVVGTQRTIWALDMQQRGDTKPPNDGEES